MIHRLQGRYGDVFVISSRQMGLPGCYDSERAAKYAFRFANKELQCLQDAINDAEPDYEKRVISFEALQALRKRLSTKE